MPEMAVLRVGRRFTLTLDGGGSAWTGSTTLEAWIRIAPDDRTIRIYADGAFQSEPLTLGVGRREAFTAQTGVAVGSVEIPPGLVLTLYPDAGCNGEPWTLDDDLLPDCTDGYYYAASATVQRRTSPPVVVPPGTPFDLDGATSYDPILSRGGVGLRLERSPGLTSLQGDRLSFGGVTLHEDLWHHVALVANGARLTWVLDGRKVREIDASEPVVFPAGDLVLGGGFRGQLAQLRVWARARTVAEIAEGRFSWGPGQDFESYLGTDAQVSASADLFRSVAVTSLLPAPPGESVAGRSLTHQAQTEATTRVTQAHTQAADRLAQAHERATARLNHEREEARRHLYVSALTTLTLRRNRSQIVPVVLKSEGSVARQDPATFGISGITDVKTLSNGRTYFSARESTLQGAAIWCWDETNGTLSFVVNRLESSPLYIAVDDTTSEVTVYWLDFDWALWKTTWIEVRPGLKDWGPPTCLLEGIYTIDGGRNVSQLTFDVAGGRLIWTSEQGLWAATPTSSGLTQVVRVNDGSPPDSVAVTRGGDIVWNTSGSLYRLQAGATTGQMLWDVDYTSALAVGEVQEQGTPTPVVFWIGHERRDVDCYRTLERLYLDLLPPGAQAGQPSAPTEALLSPTLVGARWQVPTPDIWPAALASPPGEPVLLFSDDEDAVELPPAYFDARQDWSVAARVIRTTAPQPGVTTCIYEWTSPCRDDRVAFAIDSDGLPVIEALKAGVAPAVPPVCVGEARVRPGVEADVVWNLTGTGTFRAYVDGQLVLQHDLPTEALPSNFMVFHRVGSPAPPPWAGLTPAQQAAAQGEVRSEALRGWLRRFRAWALCLTPEEVSGSLADPPPQVSTRALVPSAETWVSSRVHVMARPVDQHEPPLRLWPAEAEDRLALSTDLGAIHARYSQAQAALADKQAQATALRSQSVAAAQAQIAAQQKRMQDASAKVANKQAEATAQLAQARVDATTQVAAAQKELQEKTTAARAQRAAIDEVAKKKKLDAQADADKRVAAAKKG